MKRKLGCGLIGCGNCGEHKHLASCKKFAVEVEPVAVYDADPSRAKGLAERRKIAKVYGRYEELLADSSIDVVSIVTPNVCHASIAIAALKAGKHVHIEKSIAMNAREVASRSTQR